MKEENYDCYKYYKGEKEDPFDYETRNIAHNFWEYEKSFEDVFLKGNFSLKTWYVDEKTKNFDEWKEVLGGNPVDKRKLFELWLPTLFEHIVDKYESTMERVKEMYDNETRND